MKTLSTWLFHLILIVSVSGCGSWLGNPSKPDGGNSQPPKGDVTSGASGMPGSMTDPSTLGSGEVMMQLVELDAGAKFTTSAALTSLELVGSAAQELEVSLTDPDHQERVFVRNARSEFELEYTASAQGSYIMWVRNNSNAALKFSQLNQTGYLSGGNLFKSLLREDAPNKNLLFKAVVVFARECKDTSTDGNSTTTTTAPAGHAFAQAFAFVGSVGSDFKVSPITDAEITINSGENSQALKRLSDMPFRAYREMGGLNEEEHRDYTTRFYQSYFGGAGEFYTVESFRKYGDCSTMTALPINTDLGTSDIKLNVKIPSLGIEREDKLRLTSSTAFSTYFNGARISDWTQCTYDGISGDPTTYNGEASECKKFSKANPPEIRLDYQLPSADPSAGLTKESDPTRAVFYGHSKTAEWQQQIRAKADGLRSGTISEIELSKCANNGGLIAVPLRTEGTSFPIGEFNAEAGDVINLARKTGSYAALPEFFQGNIDASGEFKYPTCIPDSSSSCADFKLVTVKSAACSYKADSGITTTSLGDAMIYPDYFEISGIVEE
jgi:hypothetical protein